MDFDADKVVAAAKSVDGLQDFGDDSYREPLERLIRVLARPDILVGLLVATGFGLFSLLQFPYAVDNSALYWIAQASADPGSAGQGNEGAIGYLAWLSGPCLLAWPGIAPATNNIR